MQRYWSKVKKKDRTVQVVQVLSTPWADSTVVPSAKVNCRPWVTVPFAQSTTVFKNRFSLGIHVHTSCTHSKPTWNQKRYSYFKTKFALFGSYYLP